MQSIRRLAGGLSGPGGVMVMMVIMVVVVVMVVIGGNVDGGQKAVKVTIIELYP